MNVKELETKFKVMEKELQRLKDIEAITKLQRIYGYYLTTWMNEELIDLFSDHPETAAIWSKGTYLGKKGIKICFGNTNKAMDPEFMHQLMQLQGVIDIAADGKTAKGRWWGFGAIARTPRERGSLKSSKDEGIEQHFSCGVYENEYIKEDSIWKIWKIKWVPLWQATPAEGWVKPERLSKPETAKNSGPELISWWAPDISPKVIIDYAYPSGYIMPFHFKHPVTGKKSTEGKRNARVKVVKYVPPKH